MVGYEGLRPSAALAQMKKDFVREEILDGEWDARLLLEHVLEKELSQILMADDKVLSPQAGQALEALVARRMEGEPVQYLTNRAYFYGRPFYVDNRVLIPRRDTEAILAAALERLTPGMAVLDLCCGSGCIGVTLALEEDICLTLGDISTGALAVTAENCRRYGVDANLVEGDLFQGHEKEAYDMIVTNPPYVEDSAILAKEVSAHEPENALFAGAEGLDVIARIVVEAKDYLRPGGHLLIEHGYGQGMAVEQLCKENGYHMVQGYRDMEHRDRVVAARSGV
ncbi:peptide chain release factor N(5)-glutamine methyltransferase [Eubacteriales bacterium OttesenSCG-928-M02]|nr:peptide chain release factor N(5)-glutamine methyltransferase [Eubacteriales bacterium OttesenSCG-928-M02]